MSGQRASEAEIRAVERELAPPSLPTYHDLKCWAPFFEDVLTGSKTFEVRKDDRGGYRVGDVLHLLEWTGTEYSGRTCLVTVTYVLSDAQAFGVREGYVVMGIERKSPA